MALRYAGTCRICGQGLAKGERAYWDAAAKTVSCLTCAATDEANPEILDSTAARPEPVASSDFGIAGRSAQREYERRTSKRNKLVRGAHPIIGGAILAAFDAPQTTTSWGGGAIGEVTVGGRLDTLKSAGVVAVHDRLIPGSRANIDHIAVAPSGIYVIDAKRYRGQVSTRKTGWLLGDSVTHLYVGRRDQTERAASVSRQAKVVSTALEGLAEAANVPIEPMLVFVDAEWRWFADPFHVDHVWVGWPKAMAKRVGRPGPLDEATVLAIAGTLAKALRPA
ncbi:MAG: hypothetical protein JWO62_316 [Acidimicrobiaceae bacterium]|nr:hypothetical protein [Acidimicrobiaceae bacterium]